MKILKYFITILCSISALIFLLTTEVKLNDDPSVAIIICIKGISCPTVPLERFTDNYIYIGSPDESYVMSDLYLVNNEYGYISILLLIFIAINNWLTKASSGRAKSARR